MAELSVFDIPVGDRLILDGKTYVNKGFKKTFMPTIGIVENLVFEAEKGNRKKFFRGISVKKTDVEGIWSTL